MKRVSSRGVFAALAVGFLALILGAGPSPAKMKSVELSRFVCQTTGGGDFVNIPGFPGERIDRRLLKDIKFLRRKYKIFITDGYSRSGVHSVNGEHPLGLALDIVPNFAAGGDWNDIDRLARWAEPRQNQPRSPYRWVGYDGDANHGRGHHLHLSYSHSETRPYRPAKTMYSVTCPDPGGDGHSGPKGGKGGKGGKGDGGNKGGAGKGNGGGNNGGGVGTGGGNGNGGGVSARGATPTDLAPVHPETGGVDG